MQLIWRPRAEADLDDLVMFIVERNPTAARRVLDAIRCDVTSITNQPHIGRVGKIPGTREMVVARTPYIVAYTVDLSRDTVIILRVLHGSRDWPAEMA